MLAVMALMRLKVPLMSAELMQTCGQYNARCFMHGYSS